MSSLQSVSLGNVNFISYFYLLIVLVTPEQVDINGFFATSDNECSRRRVEWKLLDTGCIVEYNIQFLDNNGMILGNETVKKDNINFFCADNYTNASSVIMSATFNGVTGIDSAQTPFQITTTTTIPPTTTVTRTTQGNMLYEHL